MFTGWLKGIFFCTSSTFCASLNVSLRTEKSWSHHSWAWNIGPKRGCIHCRIPIFQIEWLESNISSTNVRRAVSEWRNICACSCLNVTGTVTVFKLQHGHTNFINTDGICCIASCVFRIPGGFLHSSQKQGHYPSLTALRVTPGRDVRVGNDFYNVITWSTYYKSYYLILYYTRTAQDQRYTLHEHSMLFGWRRHFGTYITIWSNKRGLF